MHHHIMSQAFNNPLRLQRSTDRHLTLSETMSRRLLHQFGYRKVPALLEDLKGHS